MHVVTAPALIAVPKISPHRALTATPGLQAGALAAPPELSTVAAYRHAVAQVFASMAGPEFDYVIARQRLLYSLPEAKGALWVEHVKAIRLLTQAIAQRLNRPEPDEQMQVTAGAIIGVYMAVSDDAPTPGEAFLLALDALDKSLHG